MKRTLAKKMILGLMILGAALIVVTDLFVGGIIIRRSMGMYRSISYAYSKSAADLINGDRVLGYLESGETDSYYLAVSKYIHSIVKNSDIEHFYVFVPGDDSLIYIWDADYDVGENCIGETEKYSKNAKKQVEKVFKQNPEEEFGFYLENEVTLATAVSPIFNSDGVPVAIVGVDVLLPKLRESIIRAVLHVTFGIIIIMSITVSIFFKLINKSVITPITSLKDATDQLVNKLDRDEEFHTDIHSGDEIEALARSFEKMDVELREYIKDNLAITAEKERIGAELDVATKIQLDMLPSIFPAFPDRDDIDIYAMMDPAREVGGDFYDFFLIDHDHVAIVVADVSGKGVPAALFMVIAKTLIKNQAQQGNLSSEDILRNVNNQLCDSNELAMFVTVYLAIIDLRTGKGVASNAGHEHPVLRHKGGKFEYVKYEHSPVVGIIPELEFPQHEFRLQKGDVVFLYTDGVPEATDAKEKLFGEDRLINALNKNPDASLRELLDNVSEDINSFVGEASQFDDITMLVFVYNG